MTENNLGILEAIDIAMDAELKANEFYLNALKKVSNDRGKNLLQQLANFEQNHYDKLNELKASLIRNGEYIEYTGTKFLKFKQNRSIEISKKIEVNKDGILEILAIAIDAEAKAHEHYNKMADETSDTKGKEMFQKLAEEETLHRRILSDEFYQLNNHGGIWFWGD